MGIFSQLFQKGQQRVIGLDIGSSAVKAVQLRQKDGKLYLDSYGSFALGPYRQEAIGKAVNLPPEQLAEVVSELTRAANFTVKQAGVAIPFNSSMVTIIELPPVPENQLEQMVPLEARKYIPSDPEEVSLDWSLVAGQPGQIKSAQEDSEAEIKPLEILLVAIRDQILEQYQVITDGAELKVVNYEIEIFSTIRSVLNNEDTGVILIVDIGANETKLYLLNDQVVRLTDLINRGSQDITNALTKSLDLAPAEAETVKRDRGLGGDHPHIQEATNITLDYIFNGVKRMIENYQAKNNQSVDQVILTGGGAALKGLDQQAKEALQVPVKVADPFANIATPKFLQSLMSESGPEFAVAIGVALRALDEI